MSAAAVGRFTHDGLFYGSDEELLSAAVPFLRAGLDADETVMLVCRQRNAALLTQALDSDPRITLLSRAEIYQRTPAAIAATQRMMENELTAGAHRVRLVGEVDFGTKPPDWAEGGRLEAVANRALAPYPLWSLCLYDTRRLPHEVLESGELTHPNLVTATSRIPNPRYLDPAEFLRRTTEPHSDPIETTEPALEVPDVADLRLLRRDLRAALVRSGLPSDTAEDFALAVNEATTNALIHGRRPVRVRLWSTTSRAVCAITDQGAGFDDPFAGYLLAQGDDPSRAGRGLWLARHLCDRLNISMTLEGFAVRLMVRH